LAKGPAIYELVNTLKAFSVEFSSLVLLVGAFIHSDLPKSLTTNTKQLERMLTRPGFAYKCLTNDNKKQWDLQTHKRTKFLACSPKGIVGATDKLGEKFYVVE